MFYEVLNEVLTKFLNITGKINRVKELEIAIYKIFPEHGILEVTNNSDLRITFKIPDSSGLSYEEIEEQKLNETYQYDWKVKVRDFTYPAVVYRTYSGGAIWVRNNGIFVFDKQSPYQTNLTLNSKYSVQLSEFSKEDLFGIRLMFNFEFEDEVLYDAIRCYKLLKKDNLKFIFDFTKKGTTNEELH